MIKLIWTGRPITKKNHGRIVMRGKYPIMLPSEQFLDYQEQCLWQIGKYGNLKIDYPVNVKCLYYMPTRHKVDITNLLNATHDILVEGGVLADDNSEIVVSVDGSRVFYDKDNPRVEIEIEGMKDEL